MKSLFGGSLGLGLTLLTASLLFYSSPLAAETRSSSTSANPQPTPAQTGQQEASARVSIPPATSGASLPAKDSLASKTEESDGRAEASAPAEAPVAAPVTYVATAYNLRGRGASGLGVRKGTIAADPKVLPFGTRVRLDAGPYSGEYLVTDSGSAVKGNKIDLWVPSYSEACRFGRRKVKLTVLSYGARRGAKARKSSATKIQ